MMTADPTWDYAHTAEARVRRVEKAYRLADAIDDFGRIPDAVERRQLLRNAGIPRASDETWAMAIEIHRERRS